MYTQYHIRPRVALPWKVWKFTNSISIHFVLQSSRKEFGKMEKALDPEEYDACQVSQKEKHKILDALYNECVDSYRHILEKVASAS